MAHMLNAKDLWICWSDNSKYWEFIDDPRFSEVAKLKDVCWLDIKGSFNTAALSPATRYTVALILKFADCVYGLRESPVEVSLQIGDDANAISKQVVSLDPESSDIQESAGGGEWKEVKMGEFVARSNGGVLNFRLVGTDTTSWKSGLLIGGVEIRPQPSPSSAKGFQCQKYIWLAAIVLLAASIIFAGKRG